MATLVEQFVATLKWDIPASEQKKLQQFEKSLDRTIGGFTKLAKVAAAAGAALFGAMTIVNQKTAENKRLAESIGVTIEEFEAWGDVMDDVGLSGDKVTRMMLDFNKNIGELKGTGLKSLEDSLKMVGLRLKDIEDLNPRDQFMAFMDAAKGVDDVQLAIGAASKLLGRQGKFIIPYLHNMEGSMQDILDRALGVVQLTTEGAEGAEQWARAMDTIKTASGTLMKQFLGLLGGALAPYLDILADWVVENKELIQIKVKEWVENVRLAIVWLIPKVVWLYKKIRTLIGWIDDAAQAVGGWENALRLIGLYLGSAIFLKAVLMIRKLGIAAMWTQLKLLLIPAAFVAIILIIEDIITFLDGDGKSVTGALLKSAGVSEETVENIRAGWAGLKETMGVWGDGFVETMWAFWKEVGDGFGMLVVNPIKQGIQEIIDDLFRLPLAEFALGETREGTTGARKGVYRFGEKKEPQETPRIRLPSMSEIFLQTNTPYVPPPTVNYRGVKPPDIKIEAPINITPAKGLDAKQIERAAKKGIGQAISQAKRANSTGVER